MPSLPLYLLPLLLKLFQELLYLLENKHFVKITDFMRIFEYLMGLYAGVCVCV